MVDYKVFKEFMKVFEKGKATYWRLIGGFFILLWKSPELIRVIRDCKREE